MLAATDSYGFGFSVLSVFTLAVGLWLLAPRRGTVAR
jgi:hypothetical protein